MNSFIASHNIAVRQGELIHTGKIYGFPARNGIYRRLVLTTGEIYDIEAHDLNGVIVTTDGEVWQLCGGKEVLVPSLLASEDADAGMKR